MSIFKLADGAPAIAIDEEEAEEDGFHGLQERRAEGSPMRGRPVPVLPAAAPQRRRA